MTSFQLRKTDQAEEIGVCGTCSQALTSKCRGGNVHPFSLCETNALLPPSLGPAFRGNHPLS